jgi:phosphoribosylformimino-5-aminoimidazole carboxamide ribotide isomerase
MMESSRFTIYPAIDLRRGRCVRLEQGEAERETVYGEDPAEVAGSFARDGAVWVHVVDLDAAFGDGSNRAIIRALAAESPLRVQTGGGLRDDAAIAEVLEAGAGRAVIGTAALERPDLVERAVKRWGADRIAVGLDARGLRPAARGWREQSELDVFEVGRRMADLGVRTLIYTDIDRDGMLVGPNIEIASELARRTSIEVIASGGVGRLDDVAAVADAGLAGVILGKALYERRVSLEAALAVRARPEA